MRMNLNPINNSKISFQAGGIFKSRNDSRQVQGIEILPISNIPIDRYSSSNKLRDQKICGIIHELRHAAGGAASGNPFDKVQLIDDSNTLGGASSCSQFSGAPDDLYDNLAYDLSRAVISVAPAIKLSGENYMAAPSITDVSEYEESINNAASGLARISTYSPQECNPDEILFRTRLFANSLKQRAIKSAADAVSSINPQAYTAIATNIIDSPNKAMQGSDLYNIFDQHGLTQLKEVDDDFESNFSIDPSKIDKLNHSIRKLNEINYRNMISKTSIK